MATSWKSQQGEGKYALQFETDSKEKYKLVEKAVQMAVDGKTANDLSEGRHGYWEDGCATDSNGNVVYRSIDCSECCEYFKIQDHDSEYWKDRFKVCPFCGAKMDGKEGSDNES